MSGDLSTTGSVTGGKVVRNPDGTPKSPLTGESPMPVPDLNPLDFCGNANYILRTDGYVLRVSDGTLHDARSTEKFGFKRSGTSPLMWDHKGSLAVRGTFCAHGNVKVGDEFGTPSNPFSFSLIATGSIQISGNPYIKPASVDSILLMAGGDLQISGNPTGSATSFEGLIYAGSQCQIKGNPRLRGQLICKNKPNPAGSENWVTQNVISGNPEIIYDCNGRMSGIRRISFWAQPAS